VIYLRQADPVLRLAGHSPRDAPEEPESGLLFYTVEHARSAAERADGTLTLIGNAMSGRHGTRAF